MKRLYGLYHLSVREGVTKNMKRTFLEVLIAATLLLVVFRNDWSKNLQWDIGLYDVWLVILLALGISFARGAIELVFVLAGGSITRKPIVH